MVQLNSNSRFNFNTWTFQDKLLLFLIVCIFSSWFLYKFQYYVYLNRFSLLLHAHRSVSTKYHITWLHDPSAEIGGINLTQLGEFDSLHELVNSKPNAYNLLNISAILSFLKTPRRCLSKLLEASFIFSLNYQLILIRF